MTETAEPSLRARWQEFHDTHPLLVWGAIFLVPVLVVGAGVLVAPEIFWDHFLWQDIVGPLWADAHQCSRTVTCHVEPPNDVPAKEGYTITSELTYGLILAVALYAIYSNLFVRLGVKADAWYVIALLPFILLGPTARTLEDANVFLGDDGIPGALAYGFISPVIYIHIAVYAVSFTLLGVLVQRAREAGADPRALLATVGAVLVAEVAAYSTIATGYASGFQAVAPVWAVALAAVAGFAVFWWRVRAGDAGVNATVFALGLPLVAPAVALIAWWLQGNVWSEAAWNGDLYPLAGGIVVLLAIAVTLTVGVLGLLLARALPAKKDFFRRYAGGLSLALVFGHMVDGFATWVALMDPFHLGLGSYGEKHPVSDVLLRFGADTPFAGLGFPIAKLVMVLAVIGIVWKEERQANEHEKRLLGLILLAVFVLGFAPGTRDVLRVTMGV